MLSTLGMAFGLSKKIHTQSAVLSCEFESAARLTENNFSYVRITNRLRLNVYLGIEAISSTVAPVTARFVFGMSAFR